MIRSLGYAILMGILGTTSASAQICGDGSCDPPETPCNCPSAYGGDCAPVAADDGCCRWTATGVDCETDPDCACVNGPGECTEVGDPPTNTCWECLNCDIVGYNSCNCPEVSPGFGCPFALDDGCCNDGEDAIQTADCLAICDNGICEPGEDPDNCIEDCAPVCPDGLCNGGETECDCPADCTGLDTCGNGCCGVNSGETACNCPLGTGGDCPGTCCGNLLCEPGEDWLNCYDDCRCGDGTCDSGPPYNEDGCTCQEDCTDQPCCGNGICEISLGENCDNCGGPGQECECPGIQVCRSSPPYTCGLCGNGVCDPAED